MLLGSTCPLATSLPSPHSGARAGPCARVLALPVSPWEQRRERLQEGEGTCSFLFVLIPPQQPFLPVAAAVSSFQLFQNLQNQPHYSPPRHACSKQLTTLFRGLGLPGRAPALTHQLWACGGVGWVVPLPGTPPWSQRASFPFTVSPRLACIRLLGPCSLVFSLPF